MRPVEPHDVLGIATVPCIEGRPAPTMNMKVYEAGHDHRATGQLIIGAGWASTP
jgi:hypothetical protein